MTALLFMQPGQAAEQISLAAVQTAIVGSDQSGPVERSREQSGHHGASYRDDSYATLRDFVRQIEGDQSERTDANGGSNAEGHATHPAYSALADFARTIGAERPKLVATKPKAVAVKAIPSGDAEATLVGSKVCLGCHGAAAAEFDKTLMGRINKTTRKGSFECENCHGAGSLHVKAGGGRGVGGILGFGATDPRTVEERNEVCLNCHEKGERTAWKGSTHETRGLACTNCHTVMKDVSPKRQLKTAVEMDTCFQCHKLQRAQMQRSSHMPIREGKLTCTNCHNPHGSKYGTEAMLRESSINNNCYKCHADKRGPLLHEHAPVRENCLNCHQAHGSNHEYLLKVQRPRLCAQCHSFAHGGQTGFAANQIYAFGHGCNNCHTNIHGSNSPSGAYFLR